MATGQNHLNGHEDVAFITVYFPDNMIAHINVNWLSPVKVRTTLIGGEKKMLVWNDLEADEKIKVYDKGVNITTSRRAVRAAGQLSLGRHVGAADGADRGAAHGTGLLCGLHHERIETPFNDGIAGLRVVRDARGCDRVAREQRSDESRCAKLIERRNQISAELLHDVKLGQGCQTFQVHQPVWMRDRR